MSQAGISLYVCTDFQHLSVNKNISIPPGEELEHKIYKKVAELFSIHRL